MSTSNFNNLAEPKCGRGKFIRFWKNGDPYSVCYRIYINPNKFRTWNSILTYLTDYMQPEFGAVRKVFCLQTGKSVCCFNHLDPNEKYVVAAWRSGLQKMENGYRTASEMEMLVKPKPRKLYSAEFDPDKFKFVEETSKRKLTIIFVLVSGQPCQEPSKVVLTEPDFEAWENTLRVLAKLVDLPNGILYLCTIFGDIIHSPYELQNGYVYVAVPFGEKFKHMDYMGIFGRMGVRGCYTIALNVRPSTTRRRRSKDHIIQIEQSTIENPIERRIKKLCGSSPIHCCSKYKYGGPREMKRRTSETQTSKKETPNTVVSSSKAIQHAEVTDKHSMTESDAETQVTDILSDIIEEATVDLSTPHSPKSRKDVTQNVGVPVARVSVTKSRRKNQNKLRRKSQNKSAVQPSSGATSPGQNSDSSETEDVTKSKKKSQSKPPVQRLSAVTPNVGVGSVSAYQHSDSLEKVSVTESEKKPDSRSDIRSLTNAIPNGSKSAAKPPLDATPNLGVETFSANQNSDSLEKVYAAESERKRESKSVVQPLSGVTPSEGKSAAQPPSDATTNLGIGPNQHSDSIKKKSVTKSERKSQNETPNCVCSFDCIDCDESCTANTGATPILDGASRCSNKSRAPIERRRESQSKPPNCICSFEYNDCDQGCTANPAERISLTDAKKIAANDCEQDSNSTSNKISWKELRKKIEEKRKYFNPEQLQGERKGSIPERRSISEKKSIPEKESVAETGNIILPGTEKEVQTDASFVLDKFKGFENLKIKYYEQHTKYDKNKDRCIKRVVEIFNDYGNKNCTCHRKSSSSMSGDSIEMNQ